MVRSLLDGATLAEQILVVLVMLVKMVMVMALDGATLADQSSYSVKPMCSVHPIGGDIGDMDCTKWSDCRWIAMAKRCHPHSYMRSYS